MASEMEIATLVCAGKIFPLRIANPFVKNTLNKSDKGI
jgi:hypothetical protein